MAEVAVIAIAVIALFAWPRRRVSPGRVEPARVELVEGFERVERPHRGGGGVRQLSVEELLCEPAVHKHGAYTLGLSRLISAHLGSSPLRPPAAQAACQVDGERPVQELAEGGVAAHAAHVCTLPTAEGVCNARARGLGAHELDDRERAVGHHLHACRKAPRRLLQGPWDGPSGAIGTPWACRPRL